MSAFDELAQQPVWVAWAYEKRTGEKPAKPPFSPITHNYASISNPSDWSNLTTAKAFALAQKMAGVGIVLTESDDLTGVDIDKCRNPENGYIEPWAQSIIALNETYTEISPSKTGLRLFAKGKIALSKKSDAAGIELYNRGRYLTVTGDRWPGSPDAILPAPLTLALLNERLASFAPQPIDAIPASPETDKFKRIKNAALANLAAWVPALFPGATRSTSGYRVSSHNLGRNLQEDLSITRTGIVDFGVHDLGDARQGRRSAIDLVIEYGAASGPVDAAQWLAERLGVPFDDPVDPVIEAVAVAMTRQSVFETAKLLGDGIDWTRPAGLLGEMTEWQLSTSPVPNRRMAVGSSLASVAAVCGRHLYGPTGTALNLYVALLAPTGHGKDRPLSAPSEILHACGLAPLARSGKAFSVSAVEAMLCETPCCLATVDEMGVNLLSRISHVRASSHEVAIKGALQELWSRSIGKSAFLTTQRASQGSTPIECPSLTLLGASTPDAFYDSMKGADVLNGFMNRILVIEAGPRTDDDNEFDYVAPPQVIVDTIQGLIPPLKGSGNINDCLSIFTALTRIEGRKMEWGNDAKALYADFKKQINAMIAIPVYGELWARTCEYAVRLASLHAVSRAGVLTNVYEADLEWGAAIAVASARAMSDAAENKMASNPHHEALNKIKSIIKIASDISKRDLMRKVQSIEPRFIDSALRNLIDAEIIIESRVVRTGRPKVAYRWRG